MVFWVIVRLAEGKERLRQQTLVFRWLHKRHYPWKGVEGRGRRHARIFVRSIVGLKKTREERLLCRMVCHIVLVVQDYNN